MCGAALGAFQRVRHEEQPRAVGMGVRRSRERSTQQGSMTEMTAFLQVAKYCTAIKNHRAKYDEHLKMLKASY